MKSLLNLKNLICIFIVITMLSIFNIDVVSNFFFAKKNPHEHITRKLDWTTKSGKSRHAEFNIPKGYYAKTDPNRAGETIALDVIYPSKIFATMKDIKPENSNVVHILINGGEEVTLGDALQTAIDTNTLAEARFTKKIKEVRGNIKILEHLHPQDENKYYLFHDDIRGHWVHTKDRGRLRVSEAITKLNSIEVYSRYSTSVEPDPIVMHGWVMDFVEQFQITK
jgi:hypothetical protein